MQVGDKWNEWEVTDFIGEGSFGKVYIITREEFGQVYQSALKVIHVPQNKSEVESMRSEGMSEASVTDYYRSVVEDIVSEFALMSRLRGNSNIVSYEDHKVVELEDEVGWDIYIRMELLTPFMKYIRENEMTREDVVRLGIDMCRALEACQKNNIIHRDVKPENIFYSDQGTFKLGDFGIARQFEKTSGAMSKKGTYSYMAPEVYKGLPYNATVDIYSLGVVMYRLLNNNRGPFLPAFPNPIRFSDKEEATVRRMRGDEIPMPCNAGRLLGQIVLQACDYDPRGRFQSATAMRRALESVLQEPEDDRTEVLPAEEQFGEGSGPYTGGGSRSRSSGMPYGAGGATGASRGWDNSGGWDTSGGRGIPPQPRPNAGPSNSQTANKKRWIPVAAIVLVVVAFAAGFLFTRGNDDSASGVTGEGSSPAVDLNKEITVLDSDWTWHNYKDKSKSKDGLNHVKAILLVRNDSSKPISRIEFTVDSKEGSEISNDASPGNPFIAEGYVESGKKGIMVADIAKEKYNKKNPVYPDVSSYKIEGANLSEKISGDYQVPKGEILNHDSGDYYSLKVNNENSVPVNKGAMAVLVRFEEDDSNSLADAVANGTLKKEIPAEERVTEKKVFHDPGLQFGDYTTDDYEAYILDLDYYHNGSDGQEE